MSATATDEPVGYRADPDRATESPGWPSRCGRRRTRDIGRAWHAVEAHDVLGADIPLGGVPLFAGARWFGAAGVATLRYGAGPDSLVECGIHGTDERVRIEDIEPATAVLAGVLVSTLLAEDGERPSNGGTPEVTP